MARGLRLLVCGSALLVLLLPLALGACGREPASAKPRSELVVLAPAGDIVMVRATKRGWRRESVTLPIHRDFSSWWLLRNSDRWCIVAQKFGSRSSQILFLTDDFALVEMVIDGAEAGFDRRSAITMIGDELIMLGVDTILFLDRTNGAVRRRLEIDGLRSDGGVAVMDGRLFALRGEDSLISIDGETGEWREEFVFPERPSWIIGAFGGCVYVQTSNFSNDAVQIGDQPRTPQCEAVMKTLRSFRAGIAKAFLWDGEPWLAYQAEWPILAVQFVDCTGGRSFNIKGLYFSDCVVLDAEAEADPDDDAEADPEAEVPPAP